MTANYPSSSLTPIGGSEVYDEMKRHEVEVLYRAGFSVRQVAKKAEVGRNTVRRILSQGGVEPERGPRLGRPPLAVPFQTSVQKLLEERPDLPTVEILRLLREGGYDGGKDPVYRLVRQLRRIVSPPMVLFDGLCGEFSQNDFGSIRVQYLDGTEEVLHFFAARLKWSRWVYVQFVPNEQEEALLRALISSFQSFGGVPLCCVFDNPKTIVIARHGDRVQWNETFAPVALDYGFGAELCWPRRGNQKGSVENLIGFVKKNFFLVRHFHDRADGEAQLASWLHEVNHERPCRATKVIPAARIEEERGRLRPLAIPPSEYALRYPVRVGPTCFVLFQGATYSMPTETMGVNATLFLYPDRVRIMTDRADVTHPRQPPGGRSTNPKHMTGALAALSGRRAQLYYKRQRLFEVGPTAEEFLTELVHGRPRVWAWDVEQLFDLLLQHGPDRLSRAFQQALERGWYRSESVRRLLSIEEAKA